MSEIATYRLYMVRALYLLMGVGLCATIWPGILDHSLDLPLMNGVVRSLLGAIGLLALVGLRYPLQMLPLLLFEMLWKVIWLLAFALPLWRAGRIDAATQETLNDFVPLVIFPFLMPWDYVWANYIKKPGDRWRRA